MFQRRKNLTLDEVKDLMAATVREATLSANFASHIAQCEKDKAEMKAATMTMHSENQQRFSKLEDQNNKNMRIIWTGLGLLLAIQFMLSREGLDLFGRFISH